MSDGPVPICDLIAHLGITSQIDDGDLVDSAVVVFTAVDEDGKVGLRVAWPSGQNWLTRYGMLMAAAEIENYDTLTNHGEQP